MNTWVFDVDGVLTDIGKSIDTNFKDWFSSWSKGKRYYIITAGKRENVIEQLHHDIISNAKQVYYCMGNSRWINGLEERFNEFELSKDEVDWFDSTIQKSKFPIKTGLHLDYRPGGLNFSILGRNANIQERQEYINWDKETNERLNIILEFNEKFPKFESFLGGNTSIDICLKNANKGQCYDLIKKEYSEPILFFGDRCHEYGVDQPFAEKCMNYGDKYFQINNGYKETKKIIREILNEEI